ncbi:PAP2 superfamily protein [Rutstroemia sp. NJR-2017a BBW]|nr:PAP2 superfamily protein [Rutstroemia sp. NJR-2017a BBW]
MDSPQRIPGSPGQPLYQVSPERVNQQRQWDLPQSPPAGGNSGKHSRDSSVHDKISQFNSLAFQGKQLERKANDAALKRAMVGREEAESEMRRYRDEARILRRQVEEGKERERKVGERLESVMENYGRAKETHSHTQALWEKEIRRARKEGFKSQSVVVKLQEELKASRDTLRMVQGGLDQEKGRSVKREQEAFSAKYQLVGMQEELTKLQEKLKLVEQERDALRTIAKNEEVARIAAEGRIPLPRPTADEEFSSPKKTRRSLDQSTTESSAFDEEELDDLRIRLEWENQRANRAHDRIEFLEMECRLHVCAAKAANEANEAKEAQTSKGSEDLYTASPRKTDKPRTSTVFIPSEGIFKTVSPSEEPFTKSADRQILNTDIHFDQPSEDAVYERRDISYERTPSCEPHSLPLAPAGNTFLLSIFDRVSSPTNPQPQNPSQSVPPLKNSIDFEHERLSDSKSSSQGGDEERQRKSSTSSTVRRQDNEYKFHTVSTTTRIPLADPAESRPAPISTGLPLPNNTDNPALTPTMSREEALAMIRERRGRARSLAQGTETPKKQMIEGAGARRDVSAPAGRCASRAGGTPARVRARSQVRS